MKFTDFTLDAGLQEGLAEAGYITCMPVQEQVLQNALDGADLYVQSQTGTGKTAAYLVTILQRLVSDPTLAGKKALIMVPTRELAVQVEEEARILGSCMKLKSASFYGGVGYGGQQDLLKKGVDVIIGTPGRVIDLQESRTMDLSQVAFLVIDEADRMFDMGFYPDLRTLIKVLPPAQQRQTMLFSATLNATVKNLAWEYTVEAKEITIECENVTVDEIDQLLFHVSSDQKMKLLLGLLKKETPDSVIVFCNTKRMSEVVAKRLKINGYEADFIIGDLPQSKRLQVIDSFKSGSLKMLVATDVAARGIDVDSLSMVINYDLPNEAENYVHRIGRTARAGKTGKAYSFCSEQDVYNLPAIEKYIENKVPTCVPGEEDFIEDQSAHVYIRTDRYDSDYDDGDGYRGGRSGSSGRSSSSGRSGGRSDRGGRPSSGGRATGGRDDRGGHGSRSGGQRRDRPSGTGGQQGVAAGARSFEDGRMPDSNLRPEAPRGGRGDGRRGYGSRDDSRSREERDLSKLSFEERMAYYKTKYGSDEAAKAAENQRAGAQAAAGITDGSVTKSGTKIRDGSRRPNAGDEAKPEAKSDTRNAVPNRDRGDRNGRTDRAGQRDRDGQNRNGANNAGGQNGRGAQNQRNGQNAQNARGGQGQRGARNGQQGGSQQRPPQQRKPQQTNARQQTGTQKQAPAQSGGGVGKGILGGLMKKLFGKK